MAGTRLDKIMDKVFRPAYVLPFLGGLLILQVIRWNQEGESTLQYIKDAEKSYAEKLEEQYNSLPEKIKPYDTNRNGILELDEINRLERELLR